MCWSVVRTMLTGLWLSEQMSSTTTNNTTSSNASSGTESKVSYTAIAAYGAKQELKAFSYTPLPLGANQVEIDIHACGISHSDLHQIDNDWYFTTYPFVPGTLHSPTQYPMIQLLLFCP
jgi:hypothetical protein